MAGLGCGWHPALVQHFAHACVDTGEALLRVLYYDAPEYRGRQRLSVSNRQKFFTGTDDFRVPWIEFAI